MAGPFDRLFTSLYPNLVAWLDTGNEQRIATPTTPLPVTTIAGSGTQAQSTNNSTTTPLAGGGLYTGTGDTSVLPEVGCSCYSDTDGTLYFQFQNPGSSLWHTFPVWQSGVLHLPLVSGRMV